MPIKSITECAKSRIDLHPKYKTDFEDLFSDKFTNFSYRIPINITERSGNNLQDYQALITVNTQTLISAGKMRSDCGDIRFTDSDGTTLLPYWIESGCNTTNTRIWIKVPNIPANSNKTIYMYYGNFLATSMSNGATTFILFNLSFDGPVGGKSSIGGYHSCALLNNGSIACWGDNLDGQLGDRSAIVKPIPTLVLNYRIDRYEKTNGIYTFHLSPYFNDIYFIRKWALLDPSVLIAKEEIFAERKEIGSLSLILSNIGIDLGKKFKIKLIYEDGKIEIKQINLNKTFNIGDVIEYKLTNLPKGIIKKIEIFSLDACPDMLVGIKNVNIRIN